MDVVQYTTVYNILWDENGAIQPVVSPPFFFFWICRLISFFDYYGDVIRLHTPSGSFRMQEDLSASLLLLGGKWRADLFRAPPHTVTLFSSDDKRRMGKSNHFFFCVCVCVCVSIIFLSLHIVIKPWAFDCVQSPVRKKRWNILVA
jgi:hypothetical protein